MKNDFSFEVSLDLPYEDAIQLVTNALLWFPWGIWIRIKCWSKLPTKPFKNLRG